MTINNIQFLYPRSAFDCDMFRPEIEAFEKCGFIVDDIPHENVQLMLYRGFRMWKESEYPSDFRLWQGWDAYKSTSMLSIYYPLIEDICIPTFFIDKLDEENIIREMEKRDWDSVFIKNDVKSLFCIDLTASVYPLHTIDEIRENFDKRPKMEGSKYAIRKYINTGVEWPNEERYFVINNQIFHRTGVIPSIVQEAAKRLQKLGSHYYTIDAMPDFIVEINPGESSDRWGANSPELFASWFMKALQKY